MRSVGQQKYERNSETQNPTHHADLTMIHKDRELRAGPARLHPTHRTVYSKRITRPTAMIAADGAASGGAGVGAGPASSWCVPQPGTLLPLALERTVYGAASQAARFLADVQQAAGLRAAGGSQL
jgi:hypothetical protein